MKKKEIVSLAIGSAFASIALTPLAHATGENPFATTKLEAGYQLAQSDSKKMDAKCGADKKAAEAKCGADKKSTEAKCGADKKPDAKASMEKKM
jgi:uncharacterized low-complexity protein